MTVGGGGMGQDNSAGGNGGGIYADSGTVNLNGTGFTGNTAGGNGGAIYFAGGMPNLTGLDFTQNSAQAGGGIYADSGMPTLTGGSFNANTAGNGAGIYVKGGASLGLGGTVTIRGGNASGNGGGVNVANGGTLTATAGTLTVGGAGAGEGNSAGGNGGGVMVDGTFEATGATVAGNQSCGHGGGIAIGGTGEVTFVSVVATGNYPTCMGSDGGGIWSAGALNMRGGSVTGNQATDDGGGFAGVGGSAEFEGVRFTGNSAPNGQGGGAYIGPSIQLANVRYGAFVSNTALQGGGLASDGGNNVTIANNWWSSNADPTAGMPGSDPVVGASASPWLVLSHTASPGSIQPGGSSTLTASLRQNSAGEPIDPANLGAFAGQQVDWSNVALGTLSANSAGLQAGTASVLFTAGGSTGTGGADVRLDNAAVPASVTIAGLEVEQPPVEQPGPDLSISGTSNFARVSAGGTLVQTFRIADNDSPRAQDRVFLSYDYFAGALGNVAAIPSQGRCDRGNPLTCDLGTLARGGSATVEFVLDAFRPGTWTTNAEVSSDVPDASPGNNAASLSTTVLPPVVATGPPSGAQPRVRVFDGITQAEQRSFLAYERRFRGGVRVALGDVNADGVADVITAPGPGRVAEIRVFDGLRRSLLDRFFPFDPGFRGGAFVGVRRAGSRAASLSREHVFRDGVFVAAGDVNGDGRAEVITGADAGGPRFLRVCFGGPGPTVDFGCAAGMTVPRTAAERGVPVAAGDLDGDGITEVVWGDGRRIRILNVAAGTSAGSLAPGGRAYPRGAFVAAGDLNRDGHDDIVTGSREPATPVVDYYRYDPVTMSFIDPTRIPLIPGFNLPGGAHVAAGDVNGDGRDEVLVGGASRRGSRVGAFSGDGSPLFDLVPYPRSSGASTVAESWPPGSRFDPPPGASPAPRDWGTWGPPGQPAPSLPPRSLERLIFATGPGGTTGRLEFDCPRDNWNSWPGPSGSGRTAMRLRPFCDGVVSLRAGRVNLGRAGVVVPAGESAVIPFDVPRAGRRLLAGERHVKVAALAVLTDAAGDRIEGERTLTAEVRPADARR